MSPVIAITRDSERKPVGDRNDGVRLPTAQDRIDHTSGIQPLLAFTEGQFVKHASDKAASLVIGSEAPIEIPTIGVLRVVLHVAALGLNLGDLIQGLAPRERGQ